MKHKFINRITFLINSIPKNYLILANLLVFILIVLAITPSSWNRDDKKIYSQNDSRIQNYAVEITSSCKNSRDGECYDKNLKKLIDLYNFSFAEQTLNAMQSIDESTKSCHLLAHHMAEEAVQKAPDLWKYFLENINVNACGSGFLHGVLEAHLGDDPNINFDAKLSEEVCNRGDDGYRKRMCTHFMGHLFVVNTNDNLDKATPYCEGISGQLKFDCYDGIFMEHNQRVSLADHKMAELPEYTPEYAKELENVCKSYNGLEAMACWTEMAEVYAKTFGYSADKVHNKCYAGGKNDGERRSCYMKGVVILATYPFGVDKQKLLNICSFYKSDGDIKMCNSNLLSSLLYYSPKFTDRGLELCSGLGEQKDWCYAELGKKLIQFVPSREERVSLCSTAPDKYKNICASTIQ